MKDQLSQLFRHERFNRQQAREALTSLLSSENNISSIASFISAFNMRQPDIEEMHGFIQAMIEMCNKLDLGTQDAIDIVGTGGDGKNTFNISTLSAIVVAAAGVKVIKHGNYASSSVSGSSNVLETLGYQFTNDQSILRKQLEATNICFLHAPLFHPVMVKVKQIRKELSLQTFFNLLGPLINPASPSKQVLGVSHHSHIRKYQYLMQETGKTFCLVHSMDGYDEISLTGHFKIIRNDTVDYLSPEDIGMPTTRPEELYSGDTIEQAAGIFINILEGKGTDAQKNVVIANAAYAIQCAQPMLNIYDCLALSKATLESGKAIETFKKLTDIS